MSASLDRSEFLRMSGVVDVLVHIAGYAGDTTSFLEEAADTVMELTRATGVVVLMADGAPSLNVALARGQMAGLDETAFDFGHTLARTCLRMRKVLHSEDTLGDKRIVGTTGVERGLHSLIATPLRYGDEVLGVLEVCSSVSRAFDDIDTQAVELIGNALGGALGRQLALDDNAGLLTRLESTLQDAEAKARKYESAALYDSLTGLPNRAYFVARLEELCQAHQGTPSAFAVLFLDLDDFKAINDAHGHATGDAVLRETAAALKSCLREADLIARLGGDEFVVLLAWLRDAERDVQAIVSNVHTALSIPRTIEGISLRVEASVGGVAYDGASDAAAILAAADAAMYQQKKSRHLS